jgi:putative phosphoesterase
MRIGILSDTHDRVSRTRAAVSLLAEQGATLLLHCGDITIPEVVYECAPLPTYFVFGNCDDDRDGLRRAMATIGAICLERGDCLSLENRTIAMTHGDSALEVRRLLAREPDFLFTGHTHHPMDAMEGKCRRINPGALHRAATWTVAILDLASGELNVLPVVEMPS